MLFRTICILYSVVGLFLFTGIAFAGDSEEHPFSITPSASFMLLDLPEYDAIVLYDAAISAKAGNITTEDGHMTAPKFGLTMDWSTPFTFNKYPVIVEAGGYFAYMSNEQSQEVHQLSAALCPAWFAVDGTSYRNFSWPAGQYITVSSKRDAIVSGAELLVGLDEVPMGNDVTITPFVGYSIMYIGQDFTTYSQNHAGVNSFDMHLDESVTGFYNGVLGGVRLKHAQGDFEWHGSTSIAVHHVAARYRGDQTIRQVGVSTNVYDRSVVASRVSFQGKLETGVSYRVNYWKLGASAAFEFNSAVPQIRTGERFRPTYIGWGKSLAGELGLTLSYEF